MTAPDDAPGPDAPAPDDRRDDPPPPASDRVAATGEPATEAQREAQETVRSISRLEESN